MRINFIFKPVQLEPWELILLKTLLLLNESHFPKLLKMNDILYDVDSENIRNFISFTAKTLKQYKIEIKINNSKYNKYHSIKDFEKLKWSEDTTEKILKEVKAASFIIEIKQPSLMRIRNRLNKIIKSFIEGETLLWSQIETNPYTYSFQKSVFLENIQTYFKKYGTNFYLHSKEDYKIFGEEQLKTNFLACLLALEYENLIKIEDIYIEGYYSDLKIRITATDKLSVMENAPPESWQLIENETKAYIKKDSQVIFTFPSNTSNKYRYFKCLWSNYGKRVVYKDIYEFDSNLRYPDERGKKWHANDLIRNTIRKLKKEFIKRDLPFSITTNRGFIFIIKTD